MGFGIGFQEMVIIGVVVLVLFGPNRLPEMARDLGRFVSEARRSIDEFKEELTGDNFDEDYGDHDEEYYDEDHHKLDGEDEDSDDDKSLSRKDEYDL